MIDLNIELANFPVEEQREIAYFLVRYFKGSPHLEMDGKDIFQEVFNEPVSSNIREATERAIKTIEAEVGSAMEYDEATGDRVLDAITQFEDSITERATSRQISDSDTFFQEVKLPRS